MMGRQRWRGLWDRGATATAAPEDSARAGDDGAGAANPKLSGTPAGPDPGPRLGGTPAGPDPGPRLGGTPAGPDPGQHAPPAGPAARPGVPGWLERAAGWAWRLLVLGVLLY